MRWVSHAAIAGSTTAIVSPWLVPVAILGSTAPDWMEHVANKVFSQNFTHRKETHYVAAWIALVVVFSIVDPVGIGIAFSYGALTHVLADSLTPSGVPLSPWSARRFHLFGGRVSTGSVGEYMFSSVVVLFSLVVFNITNLNEGGFQPFFYPWWEYYEQGIIDGSEWKKNRLKIF